MHGTGHAMQITTNRKGKRRNLTPTQAMRLQVAKAEEEALAIARAAVKGEVPDVGTGETIIKLKQAPVGFLIDKKRIGSEERQAADEISLAFFTLSSRLMVRGIDYDRVDGGRGSDAPWAVRTAKAVGNYHAFANVWSARHKQYADPTLEIIIAAVIDERHIRGIAQDMGFDPRRIERAIVHGLRDYAARAQFAHGKLGNAWIEAAEAEFAPKNPKLAEAVKRARIEL
jgi:hypothetical protein